jgi:hypothetical protein
MRKIKIVVEADIFDSISDDVMGARIEKFVRDLGGDNVQVNTERAKPTPKLVETFSARANK